MWPMGLLFVVTFTFVYSSYSVLTLTICCHLHIGVLAILCSDFDCLLSPFYCCLVYSLLWIWLFVLTFILLSYLFSALAFTICCHYYIGVLVIPCSCFDYLFSPLDLCTFHSLLWLWPFVVTFILVSFHSLLWLWLFVVTFILVSCPSPGLSLTTCLHLWIGVFPFSALSLSFVVTFTLVYSTYSVLSLSFVVTFIMVSCPFSALALSIFCHL